MRFFNNNQHGIDSAGLPEPLAPFCPEDHPLEAADTVVVGQPPRPGGVRPDLPQRSWPMGVRVEVLVLIPPLFPFPPMVPGATPHESFILLSVEVGLLKLHVGEVKPNVFSAIADPEVDELVLL